MAIDPSRERFSSSHNYQEAPKQARAHKHVQEQPHTPWPTKRLCTHACRHRDIQHHLTRRSCMYLFNHTCLCLLHLGTCTSSVYKSRSVSLSLSPLCLLAHLSACIPSSLPSPPSHALFLSWPLSVTLSLSLPPSLTASLARCPVLTLSLDLPGLQSLGSVPWVYRRRRDEAFTVYVTASVETASLHGGFVATYVFPGS